MERLSKELTDIINEQDFCFTPDEMRTVQRALGRFKAYEDISLEPEEVKLIANVLREVGETYNCWFNYVAQCVIEHSKLQELAMAEKDGRLVMLPCKVGDIVYVVGTCRVIECCIDEAYLDDKKGLEYLVSFECDSDCDGCPFDSWRQDYSGEYSCDGEYGEATIRGTDFGKTVFLTRLEADKAVPQTAQ